MVPFLHITTRIEGRKHDKLLGEKGGGGFPYFCVMDADGAVLATHPASRDAAGFGGLVDKAQKARVLYTETAAKAATGDKAAQSQLAFLQVAQRRKTFDEVGAQIDASLLTEEQRGALAGMQFQKMLSQFKRGMSPEEQQAMRAKITAGAVTMYKAGTIPTGQQAQLFWQIVAQGALKAKDADTLAGAIAGIEKVFAGNPRAQGLIDRLKSDLAGLNAEKDGGDGPAAGCSDGCAEESSDGCGPGCGAGCSDGCGG